MLSGEADDSSPSFPKRAAVNPLFRNGLPRRGIGYLGIPVGGFAFVAALRLAPPWPLVAGLVALPLCVWLGLGLRADGEDGGATDRLVWESRKRYDWFGVDDNAVTELRLSTGIFLLGAGSLIAALWRLSAGR